MYGPTLNVPLLVKVRDHILANPQTFQMDGWITDCGTEACIAGWAVLLAGLEMKGGLVFTTSGRWTSVATGAKEVLGLPTWGSGTLFLLSGWSSFNGRAYSRARDARDRSGMAQAAAAEIDRVIEGHAG